MRRSRPGLLGFFCTLQVVFLFAPIAIAVLYAFNSGPGLSWPPEGLSLRWFRQVFSDPQFRTALQNSVVAATSTALLASTIGTAAAVVFTRRRSRTSRSAEGLALLPVMVPPLFIAVGLVATLKLTGIEPSMRTIVLGHTIIAVPFVIVVVAARLRSYDLELEAAARDLGAGPFQVLRRISLPIIFPAILGSFLLAFAISFDEILVTNFTSGSITTVPIYVLGRLRRYIDPSANAVATILLVIPWFAVLASAYVLRRSGGTNVSGGQR
jgi:spermidine/putrescine transport system permease protein